MTLYKNKYRIETTRLKSWDYSKNGYYFVTICTKNRDYLFGDILDDNMVLNEYGMDVLSEWDNLPGHYKHITLDEFIVMPNHVHGIIMINSIPVDIDLREIGLKKTYLNMTGLIEIGKETGLIEEEKETGLIEIGKETGKETGLKPVSTNKTEEYSLSEIIRGFKTFSSRKINDRRNTSGIPVWQPRFYDRIIRNEKELNDVRNYIINNPSRWHEDDYYS